MATGKRRFRITIIMIVDTMSIFMGQDIMKPTREKREKILW
jgi:hypothetical protein